MQFEIESASCDDVYSAEMAGKWGYEHSPETDTANGKSQGAAVKKGDIAGKVCC